MPVSRKSTGISGLSAAAICSSTADSAPNEETSASRSPSRSIAACRISCGSASRSSAFRRAAKSAVSCPSYAMAGLRAFDERRLAPVGGALVDVAEALHDVRPLGRGRAVGHLEGVDAATDHEAGLLTQHVADGSELAVEASLAQDRGGRVGLALQVLRERQSHHGEPRQVGKDLLHLLV